MPPKLAEDPGNTFWVIPSEVTTALQDVSKAFSTALPRSTATGHDEAVEAAAAQAEKDVAQASEAAAEAVSDAAVPVNGMRPEPG